MAWNAYTITRRTVMPPNIPSTRNLVALSVDIEVVSSDQLKKFVFGITKKKTSSTESDWTVNFVFARRDKKSEAFVDRVKVKVKVSLEQVPGVERTATNDMTAKQRNFVNGTVANALDKFEAGDITRAQLQKLISRAASKR